MFQHSSPLEIWHVNKYLSPSEQLLGAGQHHLTSLLFSGDLRGQGLAQCLPVGYTQVPCCILKQEMEKSVLNYVRFKIKNMWRLSYLNTHAVHPEG